MTRIVQRLAGRQAVATLQRLLWSATRILHLAYLATGRSDARDTAMLLYSLEKVAGREMVERLGYLLASATLMTRGRREEALALAAYATRDLLVTAPKSPLRNTEAWRSALQLTYLLEVGSDVDGRLLETWGLGRALEQVYMEG